MSTVSHCRSFNNKKYYFTQASEVAIFSNIIDTEFAEQYNEYELLKFISLVNECYLADTNETNIYDLTEYMAENWNTVKNKSRYDILDNFYGSVEL